MIDPVSVKAIDYSLEQGPIAAKVPSGPQSANFSHVLGKQVNGSGVQEFAQAEAGALGHDAVAHNELQRDPFLPVPDRFTPIAGTPGSLAKG